VSSPIATTEPTRFHAGDSVSFIKSLSDYSSAAGWSCVYYFRGYQLAKLDLTSTPSDAGHVITITAAQSATLIPGTYDLTGFATNGTDRVEIFSGRVEVLPDPVSQDTGDDTRSQARRTLDNINAVLEGRATSSILNSMVDGTRLERIPHEALLALKDRYMVTVRNEEIRELKRQGKPTGRTVYATFTSKSWKDNITAPSPSAVATDINNILTDKQGNRWKLIIDDDHVVGVEPI
jgi:hypothetical protein